MVDCRLECNAAENVGLSLSQVMEQCLSRSTDGHFSLLGMCIGPRSHKSHTYSCVLADTTIRGAWFVIWGGLNVYWKDLSVVLVTSIH